MESFTSRVSELNARQFDAGKNLSEIPGQVITVDCATDVISNDMLTFLGKWGLRRRWREDVTAPNAARMVAAAVIAAVVTSGCATSESGSAGPTRTDSAGVVILDYRSLAEVRLPAWQLDSTPLRKVGGEDAGPEHALHLVRDVVMLDHGTVVVANAGSNELRWYDTAGRLVRALGGHGEGPGEFRGLGRLTKFAADSLLAYDGSLRRFQVFDTTGQFARSYRPDDNQRTLSYPHAVGVSSSGAVIISDLQAHAPSAAVPGRVRLSYDLLLYDRHGRMLDSIASPFAWESFNPEPVGGISVGTLAIPFGFSTIYAPTRETIVLVDTETNEVRELGLDGVLKRILRPPATERVEVTPEDIRSYHERALSNAPPPARSLFTQIYEQVPIPERKPAIRWFVASEDGALWIVRWTRDRIAPSDVLVFDEEWSLVGVLQLPPGFEPMLVSADRVVGVLTDSLGMEMVHEYRVLPNR